MNQTIVPRLRRDPLMWVCGALAVVQAWILFASDPKLIIWPDSIGYLSPAVDALERGHFSHWYGRGSAYPAMLWGLLSLSPEPWIIVYGQRLLVLATYAGVAATVALLGRHVCARHPAMQRAVTLLAAFWLLTYVLYPPVVGLAYIVMPEVLFGFLLALVLAGLVIQTLPEVSTRWAVASTAVAVLASVALVLVKPHWLLGAFVLPLALPFLAPGGRRGVAAFAVGGSLCIAAVTMILPEWRLQQRYDSYSSRVFGPRSLFCNSGDLIHDYLARQPPDVFRAEVSEALGRVLTSEARARARDWPLLGFDGDTCMYGETARVVSEHFAGRPLAEARYYLGTYVRALGAQPSYLPARIGRHFGSLAAKPFNAVAGDYFLRADDRVLEGSRDVSDLFRQWLERHRDMLSGMVELPTRRWLFALRIFFGVAGLILVLVTAGAAALAVGLWKRQTDHSLVLIASGILMCGLATNVLIAIVHTWEPRYLAMQMPMFALLGFAASLASIDGLRARLRTT
jgi:hypothetical protein